MNYFDSKSAAERYAKCRPDFHINTIQHIKEYLQIHNKFDKALDIACGTGLSTKALLEIAQNVYGTDSSPEMLDFALKSDVISYSIAPAEQQPFADNEFELITVCSGVHWFDIDQFLTEAYRLLKSQSWLVLYDNYFLGKMDSNSEFLNWHNTTYLKNFPPPPRNNDYDWSSTNLKSKNFNVIHKEQFINSIFFNKESLICYLTTQSNVTAAIENKGIGYNEIKIWLENELKDFFKGLVVKKFHFSNWVRYIQKGD